MIPVLIACAVLLGIAAVCVFKAEGRQWAIGAAAATLIVGVIVGASMPRTWQSSVGSQAMNFKEAPSAPLWREVDGKEVIYPQTQDDPTAKSYTVRIRVSRKDAENGIAIPPMRQIEEGVLWYTDESGGESFAVKFR